MSNDMFMRLQLQLTDKVSGALGKITQSTKLNSQALKANRDSLRNLEKSVGLINKLKREQEAFKQSNAAMRSSQAELIALKRSGSATAAQIKAQTSLVKKNAAAFDAQKKKLVEMRQVAANSGIKNLVTDEKRLASEIAKTTQTISKQETALKRMDALRAQRNRGLAISAGVGGAGIAMNMAGRRGLNEAQRFMGAGYSFDATMSRVQALARLDSNSQQLALLRQQAKDLGDSTMFSANEAAQGQAFLAMAGFTPENIRAAMPGLLDMALAGDIDLAQAADIASNISSGFGINPAEMSRVADVLTQSFTSSNVSLEMLGDTMRYVAPNARALGISMEEVAALSGLLGNVGIQGSQAGTAMRALFSRLAKPPGMARDALEALNIQIADAKGNMRAMPDILLDIAKATEHMGNVERMGYITDIAGKDASSALSELLNQSSVGEIENFIKAMRQSENAASRTAGIMASNLKGDLDELSSGWEGLGITVYEMNNDWLRELAQSITKLVNGISAWAKENPELVAAISKLVLGGVALLTVFGGLFMVVAPILASMVTMKFLCGMLGIKFIGLIPILANVGKAMFRLGLSMLANPIFLAIAAIAALAVAGYAIYKNWDTIVWFFQDIWDQIKTAFDGGIVGISQLILNWSPLGLFYKVFAFVMDFFGITLPENFTTFASNILTSFGTSIFENGKDLLKWFASIFMSVYVWFMVDLPNAFMGFGGMIMDGLIGGIMGAMGAVKDAIGNVGSGVLGWFKEKLGISSPSKMFMRAGVEISNGAAIGITDGLPVVRQASLALARESENGLPRFDGNRFITPGGAVRFDSRPPIGFSGAQASNTRSGGDTIQIIIQGGGMDAQAIAQAVGIELERRDRMKQANARSTYNDW